jgi:hypothetical protein
MEATEILLPSPREVLFRPVKPAALDRANPRGAPWKACPERCHCTPGTFALHLALAGWPLVRSEETWERRWHLVGRGRAGGSGLQDRNLRGRVSRAWVRCPHSAHPRAPKPRPRSGSLRVEVARCESPDAILGLCWLRTFFDLRPRSTGRALVPPRRGKVAAPLGSRGEGRGKVAAPLGSRGEGRSKVAAPVDPRCKSRGKVAVPADPRGKGRGKVAAPVDRRDEGRGKVAAPVDRRGEGRGKVAVPGGLRGAVRGKKAR